MQEYRSCKLHVQGSLSRTSLQIDMQNFVNTKSDFLVTKIFWKSHFHQNVRQDFIILSDDNS